MPHTILVLARRKQGITHAYFQTRYEQHMAMVARLAGDAFPLRHTRRYLARATNNNINTSNNEGGKEEGEQEEQEDEVSAGPRVLAGALDYDVVAEMEFADEPAFGRFVAALQTPEVVRAVAEDEAGFWDRASSSVVVVGRVQETRCP